MPMGDTPDNSSLGLKKVPAPPRPKKGANKVNAKRKLNTNDMTPAKRAKCKENGGKKGKGKPKAGHSKSVSDSEDSEDVRNC
jgi:hypothetical protein